MYTLETTRRAFLKGITILLSSPITIYQYHATAAAQAHPTTELAHTYGGTAYGTGKYPGHQIYLPLITKEEKVHGSFTTSRQ